MNRCTDSLTGSPTFTITSHKLEDGRYQATCDSLPDVPKVVDVEEVDAIRQLSRNVETYIITGGVRGGKA